MAEETLLASQRVSAAKLIDQGFVFRWPELEGALRQITTP
jgi:NAD dependent epimerase/dehydratase family enzyme